MSQEFESEIFLVRLKTKDRDAIETVVTSYTEHLYKACLGLGFNKLEADDITQSVWLTFFDAIVNFEGRSKIKTFLFGILYNKASEYRKKIKKTELCFDIESVVDNHFDKEGHWVDSPKDPERFLMAAQISKIISDCIDLLPLTQKMAFHLKEVEGEMTEEICKILTITSTNLGVLIFRAKNQLRECIEKKA